MVVTERKLRLARHDVRRQGIQAREAIQCELTAYQMAHPKMPIAPNKIARPISHRMSFISSVCRSPESRIGR